MSTESWSPVPPTEENTTNRYQIHRPGKTQSESVLIKYVLFKAHCLLQAVIKSNQTISVEHMASTLKYKLSVVFVLFFCYNMVVSM